MSEPSKPTASEERLRSIIFGSLPSSDQKDDQVAQLQEQIQAVQEKAAEERFLWVLVIVVLIDLWLLGSMQNWSAPLVIGAIQLIGLVIWANRCGVNAVMPLIDRLTGAIGAARAPRPSGGE